MATIGFGNLFPSYIGSRLTWIVFEAVGIGLLANMINAFVIVVFESIQRHTEKRIQNMRRNRRQSLRSDVTMQTGMDESESEPESDNILFGHIDQTVADARKEKQQEKAKEVIQKNIFASFLLLAWW